MLSAEEWRVKADKVLEELAEKDTKETYHAWMDCLEAAPSGATLGVRESMLLAQHKTIQGLLAVLEQANRELEVLKKLMNIVEIQQINLEMMPDDTTIN